MTKRIRHSLISLFLLQGGQYLASLILLPILAQRLGIEGYGEMGFCLALTAYLGLLVEWGYGVTSTKAIAICRGDVAAQSQIFWRTFFGKLILLAMAALGLVMITEMSPSFLTSSNLLWLAFGMVVANGLAPNFFYQGVEKLEVLFSINVGLRFLSIPLILVLVHDAGDVDIAQGIVSGAVICAAIINLYLLWRLKMVQWIRPEIQAIYSDMRAAAPLFLSMAAVGLFANSLTVILGYASGVAAVGAFTAALNLYKAAQGIFAPLYQIMFPKFSHLFHYDEAAGVRMLKKVLLVQTPLTMLVAGCLAISAPWILPLLLGSNFDTAVPVFQWMCLILVLNGIANLIGGQLMVALNYHLFYTKVVLVAGGISLPTAWLMNLWVGDIGSVWAMLIFEAVIIGACVIGLHRFNSQILKALQS